MVSHTFDQERSSDDLKSRIHLSQDMGDLTNALTDRMQKLEENVISEQEHSLKLLDTILRNGKSS